MMKYFPAFVLLMTVAACSLTPKKAVEVLKLETPNIVKEITEGILHPESIVYSSKHQAYFVSNIASGNPTETKAVGYIAKYARDGKLIKAKWVTGLHAPKGIAIVGDHLYVSDVTRIQKISISKAKIIKTFTVKDSKFLNDIVVDDAGNIYISDMWSDIIYRIQKDKLSVWVKDAKVAGSNGLFTDGKEHILAVRWGTELDMKTWRAKNIGDMAIIPLKDPKNITNNTDIQGHLDGIAVDGKGMLWISDWLNGDVYSMEKNGKVKKMFNLGAGTADLTVVKELNLLVVPQMNQNKIIFIQL
jgi:sugar lactone lactonase YvrE